MAANEQDGGGTVYLKAKLDVSGLAADANEGKAVVKDFATSVTTDVSNANKSLSNLGGGSNPNLDRMAAAFGGVTEAVRQMVKDGDRELKSFVSQIQNTAAGAESVTDAMVAKFERRAKLKNFDGTEMAAIQPYIAGLRQLAAENNALALAEQQSAEATRKSTSAAAEAAAKFNAFERAVQTSKIELLSFGKTASEKFQIRAEVLGLDKNAATQAILADLRAAEAQVAATANTINNKATPATKGLVEGTKAYNAALRQVPAQITDIVVGLQGGQAPLTVLLQQGGQLRDVFGSVSGAAQALGRQLLALVTPWTVAAGAAAGLGYAIYSASEEAKALNKALILSNGSTGATITELNRYAASMIDAGVGAGTATDALIAFIGAGVKASGGLQEITKAAIDLEKYGGASVEETAKAFAKLSKDPLAGVEGLTLATYKQIEALLKQGDQLGATAVAQQAFIDNTNNMAKALAGQEGPLDVAIRSWKEYGAAVGNAARAAGKGLGLLPRTGDEERRDLQARRDRYKAEGYDTSAEDARLAYFKRVDEAQRQTIENAARETKLRELLADFDKKDERSVKQRALNQAITDYGTLLSAGLITVGQYAEAINKLNKVQDKPKTSTGLSDAAKGVNLYNDLVSKSVGYSADYAEKVGLLSAAYASGAINATELSAAVKQFNSEQQFSKDAAKVWEEQTKASNKAVAESVKEYEKLVSGYQNAADAAQKNVQKLEDEEKALVIAAAQNISLAQAIEQVQLARLREAQAAQLRAGNQEAADAIKAEIEAREKLIGLIGNKEVRDANAKAAKQAAADWAKTAEKIENSITDALMRGFESGKGFAENLRDTVVNMFKTLVLRPIVSAVVNPIAGAITGTMGLSGAANAANTVGGIGNAATAFSIGGLGNPLTNIGGFLSNGVADFGTALVDRGFTQLGSSFESFGLSMKANEAALNTFGDSLGYLSAAVYATEGKWGAAIGAGIGTWFGGPIGAAIGGAIGGWVDNAFGGGKEYTTGTGISGKFSDGGFSGRNYQSWRNDGSSGILGIGGSGSSSGTNYSALDSATERGLSQGFMAVQYAASGMAASLGLDAKKITTYSQDITLALSADADKNKKAIEELFNGVADNLALAVAPKIADFSKSGETASATLGRLSTSIITSNAWLSLLRQRLFQVSLAGADAASKLADAFGGLDKLTASSQAFYEAYYTTAEKVSANQKAMTDTLAALGLALPDTKDQFKALALSMDLNTESGRTAYATLLKLAPEFAATSDMAAQAAKDTADALMKAFTANGKLVPALDTAALSLAGVQAGADVVVTAMTQIHSVMGDTTSPVITLTGVIGTLSTELTGAQKSSLLLQDQIDALSGASAKAVIDFDGLTNALAGTNTATFVETIGQVFDVLAKRITTTIDAISNERVAVRDAALQIINPTVMSKSSILAGIAGVNTQLPSTAALTTANNNLYAAIDKSTAANSSLAAATADNTKANTDAATSLAGYKQLSADIIKLAASYGLGLASTGGGQGYGFNSATNRFNDYAYVTGTITTDTLNTYLAGIQVGSSSTTTNTLDNMPAFRQKAYGASTFAGRDPNSMVGRMELANAALDAAAQKIVDTQAALTAAQSASTTAAAEKTAAEAVAKQAIIDYQKALQNFALDASKSVSKLSNLRQETVKYYEAQKALADLMQTSATNLLSTVATYRFQQLSPEAQSASLQSQFSSAYSMALASQGDGTTLASYADKLNSTLGPLIDSLTATGQDSLINSFLAQAEAVAKLLQDNAPQNYAADSLDMLGSIDATLAALDASSKSAERVISDAVTAGSDRTAAGLYAVIAAITGKTVPAFASGGSYGGGLALVGENGPELINFDQGGQVYNASQTAGMFGSGGDVVAELQALRAQIEAMSAETRATAIATVKTSKILERVTPDGVSLQTVAA